MNILIAEDDPTSRAVLVGVLGKLGHEVTEACDGAAAWELAREPGAPRLLLLDWMMPELDGVELCRRLKECQPDAPPYVILVTARSAKADLARGLDAGADDYVVKPFDPEELRARIDVGTRMLALQARLAGKIGELQAALGEIRTLRGIIPICAGCKKIRNEQGAWTRLEAYIREHSHAEFSHGLCEECVERLYPEFVAEAKPPEDG
ncbi:MAG: response regulator transcription factor [Thermodesulfobacteriota bacterium]